MDLKILMYEKAAYQRLMEIRTQFQPHLFDSTFSYSGQMDRQQAFVYATDVVIGILRHLEKAGLSLDKVDPGHGVGHWTRDFVNARILMSALEFEPAHIFAGMVGGALHDIGCALVPRYQETQTPIRHAEVAGLMLDWVFSENDFGLTKAGQRLTQWAVMAHTQYLKPQTVIWRGKEVVIEPYQDMAANDKPLYGIWIPRWVDRLECNGSETFPARHWLTLHEDHEDFSGDTAEFFSVHFADHVQPIIRSSERIKKADGKQTMLEHLLMFANSQTNISPYGKHDVGTMVEMRDAKKERLLHFVHAVAHPQKQFQKRDRINIIWEWSLYLGNFIEPTSVGRLAARKLQEMLFDLHPDIQNAWCNGFLIAMKDYLEWCRLTTQILEEKELEFSNIPFVGDLRRLFQPSLSKSVLYL